MIFSISTLLQSYFHRKSKYCGFYIQFLNGFTGLFSAIVRGIRKNVENWLVTEQRLHCRMEVGRMDFRIRVQSH